MSYRNDNHLIAFNSVNYAIRKPVRNASRGILVSPDVCLHNPPVTVAAAQT